MKLFKTGDLIQINKNIYLSVGLDYEESIQCNVGDLFLIISDNLIIDGEQQYEILSVKTDRVLYWHKNDLHSYKSPYFSKIEI
jgi:hypothetical protein